MKINFTLTFSVTGSIDLRPTGHVVRGTTFYEDAEWKILALVGIELEAQLQVHCS